MGCGTLLQLVSYGSQDIYLTGNPQITFFKAVYKRHTNFTIESIEQVFTNNIQSHCITNSCIISKKGDLLYNMYLEIDLIEPIETDINNTLEIISNKLGIRQIVVGFMLDENKRKLLN